MIFRIILLCTLLLSASCLMSQDINLCYEHDYDAGTQIDTLRVYLKGNPDTTISLSAVNASVAFHDSCARFDTLISYFTGVWGTFFEQVQVSNTQLLTYNRRSFDGRVQYGNSDPRIPMPNPVTVPNSANDSLLIFKIVFKGACSQKLYLEDQGDNSLNQFGDEQFDQVSYAYFPCQGRDSVRFCTRQQRDSLAGRDSLRIFIENNPQKTVGLSEVNFSIAFRDSCTQFDSLQSQLNDRWGDTLALIRVEDSLNLMYNGQRYDSRLSYRHQNPNFSATNLLFTPPPSPFPDWVCSLYFSGACSDDLFIENQLDNQENLMLNPLDEPLEFAFGICDSLPEDTVTVGIDDFFETKWSFFPNPMQDKLGIDWGTNPAKKLQVTISDLSGKIVWKQHVFLMPGKQTFDLPSLASGSFMMLLWEGKNIIGKQKMIRE